MYQISRENLFRSLARLNHEYPLFIPVEFENHYYFEPVARDGWKDESWFYPPLRTTLPLKTFYTPPLKQVSQYPGPEKTDEVQPLVIIGPKACDIHALKIMDKVYAEGEFPEPYYVEAREKNIIISTDCRSAGPHCYCTLMNYQPYPKADFDLNLSQIDGLFLIEICSEKGKKILESSFINLEEAPDSMILERERQREMVTEQVEKQNEKYSYFEDHKHSIERHLDSGIWEELSKTCVECGTCTQICPTCHCFLMYDQPVEDKFERIKVWDSCFFGGYSRMAGGLTPRLRLAERFKNRFYHKFNSFVANFGLEACTGCGRCVEGCMGNIDLRDVLMELEKRVVLRETPDLI